MSSVLKIRQGYQYISPLPLTSQHNSMQVYLEVHPIVFNWVYSQENVYKIPAVECVAWVKESLWNMA